MHCEKPKIIEMRNVGMCYPQGDMALRDVDLCIHEGDFVAITGRNGGGKTTLVRLILQLLKPTAGAITYYRKGEQVKRLNMGYLPQKNSIDNRFPITVDEVVASGLDSMNRFFHCRNSSATAPCRMPWRWLGSATCAIKASAKYREANCNARCWQGQSSVVGRCLCSTSRCRILTRILSQGFTRLLGRLPNTAQ